MPLDKKYQGAYDFVKDHNPKDTSEARDLFGQYWSEGARKATFFYLNERASKRVQVINRYGHKYVISRDREGHFKKIKRFND